MMATRYVQQITGQEHSLLYTGKVAHDFIFYHIFCERVSDCCLNVKLAISKLYHGVKKLH